MKYLFIIILMGAPIYSIAAIDPFDTSQTTVSEGVSPGEIEDLKREMRLLKQEFMFNKRKDQDKTSGLETPELENIDYKRVESFIEAAGKFYLKLPSGSNTNPTYVKVTKKDFLAAMKQQNAISNNNKNEVEAK